MVAFGVTYKAQIRAHNQEGYKNESFSAIFTARSPQDKVRVFGHNFKSVKVKRPSTCISDFRLLKARNRASNSSL